MNDRPVFVERATDWKMEHYLYKILERLDEIAHLLRAQPTRVAREEWMLKDKEPQK